MLALTATDAMAGDRVRINAQLIDASSGGDIWADRFDGSLGDVFSLQDRVTRSIADALAVKLTPAQEQSIAQKETSVPAAYDAFLEGWSHFVRSTREEYARAIPYFEHAISLDPNYGRPYAALALVYRNAVGSWEDKLGLSTHQTMEKIHDYLNKAEKRPSSLTYQASGMMQAENGAFLAAYDDFEKAIALDPSDPLSYAEMARALVFEGRPNEAIQFIMTAMRIDPHYPPPYLFILGIAQFGLDQFEAAAKSFEEATSRSSGYEDAFLFLGATYGYLNRKEDAAAAIARYNSLLAQDGHRPITKATVAVGIGSSFLESKDAERLAQGLRLAGVPDY